MAFLFDNLTAFMVGAMLLVGLLFVQQRGRQSAVEATLRYQTEVQAASFVGTLTRDLENARTKEQAAAALGRYEQVSVSGPREYGLALGGTADRTEWLQFVTLADPAAGDASPLIAVAYHLEATGETASANGATRPVHRVVRYVHDGTGGWEAQGGSAPTVVGFQVRAEPGGTAGVLTTLPSRVGFAVEMAFATPARQAGDQAETAEVGLTRQGATVRVYAAGTRDPSLPTPQTPSTDIPRRPGTPAYVAPPPSITGPAGTSGSTGTPSSSGTPSAPAPPVVVRPSGGAAV